MSEFDPSWTDEKWASILHPEILLFANPTSEAACVVDCAAATAHKPVNTLFWCAGCSGSIFPLTGFTSYHLGLVQTSSLLVHRLLAKLHSVGLLRNYKGENFCERAFAPRLDKLQYKTQLIYPVSQTKGACNRLGATTLLWEIGKEYPINGEEFIYLIWRKKHCCLDAVKPAVKKMLGNVK